MSTGSQRSFRFGVNMMVPTDRAGWVGNCRKAEDLGYDVVAVADHLGMPAPFPALVLAAEVTERVRLCTFVLNAAFYNPALLARDVAGTDQFTGGRLELGLGAGYVKAEFDAAGLPFDSARRRIDHLGHTVAELRRLFGQDDPRPVQRPGPPLLIGGNGDRVLRLAAREADIAGFTGARFTADGTSGSLAGAEDVAERVEFVRTAAGDRADDIELNVLVQKVLITDDRAAALRQFQHYEPELTVEELGELPTLLVGTAAEIADQLRAHRKRFGFSYITVLEPDLEPFAEVMELLR
ncbi:LLM class F420-dependent oxidoreductase [Qaidamihabitans albus]|uniref:LLM class F420-dependent oxidoreductase n=1 Tax=Qaidamihabitans albus TaxID=2795733 RepID=UPI0018F15589|nr:LLM class F420-dependent oxidoreductase [Qaidamihabitans albus]